VELVSTEMRRLLMFIAMLLLAMLSVFQLAWM